MKNMKFKSGTILMYECSGPEYSKLRQIFAMLRLRMRPVTPDKYHLTLAELDREAVDMLVLPGGLGGVEVLQGDRHVQALIQHCYDEGRWLAAICAAPTILANLGFLDRRRAVCYPGMEELMGSAVVQKGAPVVADGHIITGEAAGSSFPFGLKLVEVLRGEEAARAVNDVIYYRR